MKKANLVKLLKFLVTPQGILMLLLIAILYELGAMRNTLKSIDQEISYSSGHTQDVVTELRSVGGDVANIKGDVHDIWYKLKYHSW